MAIGLCGAHRTGKTTLAKSFSEKTATPFVQTSASKVFKEMGLDPSIDYPFDVRIAVQEKILTAFEQQYAAMRGEMFIADRTPIDMMAYTLADVRQGTLTPEQDDRLQKYLNRCVEVTNRVFSILVVVQPAIKSVFEPGKASLSPSYIDHVAHLVMGIVVHESVEATHFYIPKNMTGIERRVECVEHAINRTILKHQQQFDAAEAAGSPITIH